MARRNAVNRELSDILNELWALDVNRMEPEKDYCVNLQEEADGGKYGRGSAGDNASAPLFKYVNEKKLRSIPTYASFIKLLDNYEMPTGVEEEVTSEEMEENKIFLDAILKTQVMKRAHEYLVSKGRSSPNVARFKKQLFDIWFKLYNRDSSEGDDSCGFEHVFVGETKRGKKIMGLHNWVQFYLQEKLKCIDYRGYKDNDKYTPDVTDSVITLQFSWKGLVKPIGGSFFGVSPEFEVAFYTIIFLSSNKSVINAIVEVDAFLLEIVVCRHCHGVGTSYPKILDKIQQDCS